MPVRIHLVDGDHVVDPPSFPGGTVYTEEEYQAQAEQIAELERKLKIQEEQTEASQENELRLGEQIAGLKAEVERLRAIRDALVSYTGGEALPHGHTIKVLLDSWLEIKCEHITSRLALVEKVVEEWVKLDPVTRFMIRTNRGWELCTKLNALAACAKGTTGQGRGMQKPEETDG